MFQRECCLHPCFGRHVQLSFCGHLFSQSCSVVTHTLSSPCFLGGALCSRHVHADPLLPWVTFGLSSTMQCTVPRVTLRDNTCEGSPATSLFLSARAPSKVFMLDRISWLTGLLCQGSPFVEPLANRGRDTFRAPLCCDDTNRAAGAGRWLPKQG